jgi:hypothetical protein
MTADKVGDTDSPIAAASPVLNGSYTFFFGGTIFLPPPLDASNGPFFGVGEIVSDGKGNLGR